MMARSIKTAGSLAFFGLALLSFAPELCAQSRKPYGDTEVNTSALVPLLQAPQQPALKWFASTDKTGGNDDFVRLQPRQTLRVPLATGTLERLWSTAEFPNEFELTLQTGPRRTFPLLRNGKANAGLFSDKAYTLFPAVQTPTLRELEEGAALIVTNRAAQPAKWYYQVAVRPEPRNPLPALPAAREIGRANFKLKLAAGEQKTVENFTRPGLIYELAVAVNSGSGAGIFDTLRLLAQWEGQNGVNAPLMALAGQVAGEELIQNAVADFDGARLVLRWPMPFQSALLALKNEGERELDLDVSIRVQEADKAPSVYRFCAVEGAATSEKGVPVPILKLKGEGAFVGLGLQIQPGPESARRTFAFLEGDEIIRADDQTMQGTGAEDYFSSAWYFPDRPYTHPYDGLTLKTPLPPHVAAYRFHIPDAIPFRRSFAFDFEHGSSDNAEGMKWNWVALWYQKPPLDVPEISSQINPTAEATGARGNSWILVATLSTLVLIVTFYAIARIVKTTPRDS